MHTTVQKPPHGSLVWLRLRHRNGDQIVVSASECAAVHDQHRFISKWQLAADKLADEPKVTETNEAMDRGNRLEPVLLDWVADKIGAPVSTPDLMYRYSEAGVELVATLDGVIGDAANPEAVVEIKTYNREFDPADMPDYWYWQGVQQALCAGVDKVIWGVFDSTLKLHIHEQYVSPLEKSSHVHAVWSFCNEISDGDIPEDWPRSWNDIRNLPAEGGQVDISDDIEYVEELIGVQAQMKQLTKLENDLKARIGVKLGAATIGLVNGAEAVTWKEQRRVGFDTRRFQQDHPDMAREYETTNVFRVMRTKKGTFQ